jgi:hypothetical protein
LRVEIFEQKGRWGSKQSTRIQKNKGMSHPLECTKSFIYRGAFAFREYSFGKSA